jgi:hypothetical protein
VYLLNIETCPDVDEHPVGVGEVALDIERVGERNEDGLVLCFVSVAWFHLASLQRPGPTVKRRRARLDDAQALLELCLGRGKLGV